MTVTAKDIYKAVDTLAPFRLAMSWDNVGLLVGGNDKKVHKLLLALDVTESVLREATDTGADMILSHHPLIFKPLARIDSESLAYRLIRRDISVLCAHTNLDIARGGVSDCLAKQLGLQNIRPLAQVTQKPCCKVIVFAPSTHAEMIYSAMAESGGCIASYRGCGFLKHGQGRFVPADGATPLIGSIGSMEMIEETAVEMVVDPERVLDLIDAVRKVHPYEEPYFDVFNTYGNMQTESLGRIGELSSDMKPSAFAAYVKGLLSVDAIKYVEGSENVRTVAVCGGSGAEYIAKAHELGAQALVTGDSKHNLLLEADQLGITLVDAGHFSTETVVLQPLMDGIRALLPTVEMSIATSNCDIAKYI